MLPIIFWRLSQVASALTLQFPPAGALVHSPRIVIFVNFGQPVRLPTTTANNTPVRMNCLFDRMAQFSFPRGYMCGVSRHSMLLWLSPDFRDPRASHRGHLDMRH
ncbi:hypothetical protein [Stenotrophomonas rhizophila]